MDKLKVMFASDKFPTENKLQVIITRVHVNTAWFDYPSGTGSAISTQEGRFTNHGFKRGDRVTLTKNDDGLWSMTPVTQDRDQTVVKLQSLDLVSTLGAATAIEDVVERVVESGSYHYVAFRYAPSLLVRISSADVVMTQVQEGDKVRLSLKDRSSGKWDMKFLSPVQQKKAATTTPAQRGRSPAPGYKFTREHPEL